MCLWRYREAEGVLVKEEREGDVLRKIGRGVDDNKLEELSGKENREDRITKDVGEEGKGRTM